MTNRASNLRFGLLQGLYWTAFCTLFPFLVQLYRSYGYSAVTIGVITMLVPAFSTVAQPVWGMMCDRSQNVRKMFIVAMLLGGGISLLLPLGRHNVLITIGVVVCLAVTVLPMMSIVDAWALRLIGDGEGINYGLTRSVGSVLYAFTAILFGMALDKFGMWLITPSFLVGMLVVVAVALGIKNPKPLAIHEKKESILSSAKKLLKNKRYVALVSSLFIAFVGAMSMNVYYPILIGEMGGGNAAYGTGLFVMAISEAPALLLYKKIGTRFSCTALLGVSIFFQIIKIIAIAASPSVEWAIGAMVLQSASFGLYMGALMAYMPRIVERKIMITAQTLMGAISMGFSSIIGNFLGGLLSELFGVRTMMFIMSGFPVIGLLIYIFTIAKFRGEKDCEEDGDGQLSSGQTA